MVMNGLESRKAEARRFEYWKIELVCDLFHVLERHVSLNSFEPTNVAKKHTAPAKKGLLLISWAHRVSGMLNLYPNNGILMIIPSSQSLPCAFPSGELYARNYACLSSCFYL